MLKIRYDRKAFSTLPDSQKQYTVVVRNWFQVLGDVEDPTEKYEMFIEANQLATKKCVPVKENARVNILVLWKRGKLLKMLVKFTTMLSKQRTCKNLWEEARQKFFASFDSLRED